VPAPRVSAVEVGEPVREDDVAPDRP